MPHFFGADEEKMAVLHLGIRKNLLAVDAEYVGSKEYIDFPIRKIIARAFENEAVGLVIAHNHPSGDPRPSRADIRATRRLAETADALDIRLHDHLIFAGADCRSFRELGLL